MCRRMDRRRKRRSSPNSFRPSTAHLMNSNPRPILSDAARNRLIESRLTPNFISMIGLIGNLIAVGFIFKGWWIASGFAFAIGSAMDLLDGKYSRMSGKATLFGAFLDSSLDRIEEGV